MAISGSGNTEEHSDAGIIYNLNTIDNTLNNSKNPFLVIQNVFSIGPGAGSPTIIDYANTILWMMMNDNE